MDPMEEGDCTSQENESAWNEELDVSQLCRICANPNEYLIPIFQGEGLEHELELKIAKHLPIKVSQTDELPTNLCYQCASTLVAWHDMVVGCVEADEKLKSVVHPKSDNTKINHKISNEVENTNNLMSKDTALKITSNTVPQSQDQVPKLMTSVESAVSDLEMSTIKPEIMEDEALSTRFISFKNYQVAICALNDKLMNRKIKQIKFSRNVLANYEPNSAISAPSFNSKTQTDTSESGEMNNVVHNETFGRSKHQCDTCGRIFTRHYDLKRHRSVHLIVDVFNAVGSSCSDHNEKHQNSELKTIITHACEICARVFKAKDSYERHKRIHTDERPFHCDECGKCFRSSGGLTRHKKEVHAKIRNHPCNICNKWFLNRATLEDHYRVHTGERPFVCHQCGLMFKSKATLYMHSKTHTNNRPHVCVYCGKGFRRRQELVAHIPVHTNEKTHICEKCGKAFSARSALNRHIVLHSDEKLFSCLVCNLNFSQKRYLRNHMKSRHGRTEDSQHQGVIPSC